MTLGVALASLLLPLQLHLLGATGSVLQAGKGVLASSIGNIMIVSGALCLCTVLLLARNRPRMTAAEVPVSEGPGTP
jgi:hypothetical protein